MLGAVSLDGLVVGVGTAAAAVPSPVTVGTSPYGVAMDATTDTVYIANTGSSSVSVIDGATNTVIATVTVGTEPRAVAVDATTDTVYVAN
ncbi:MAG: YncE family protein, partial [Acidimicrobiales bacterium]